MTRRFLHFAGCFLFCLVLPGVRSRTFGADPPVSFVSQIAPDFAIVTEVSLPSPYVGQQFSVLYRLRARRAAAAVDVNPQQYRGFWTEVVPVPAQSASVARSNREQGAAEYLLRQVIAFPLLEGRQPLPPLSVKIKRAGSLAAARDQWDLEGDSSPVEIEVRPLPPAPAQGQGFSLVGSAEGILRVVAARNGEFALDMQGTANLSLLQPARYLNAAVGDARIRLAEYDPLIQTIEKAGVRQLSMTQRLSWRISLPEEVFSNGIEGMAIPLFVPDEERWKEVRIEGIRSSDAEPSQGPEQKAATIGDKGWWPATIAGIRAPAFMVALAAVLAGIGVFLFVGRRRKHSRTGAAAEDRIVALQKQLKASPRTFLDGAHKLLQRVAVERARRHNLGVENTRLDRCWVEVQRYRFSREVLPLDTARELLQSIRQMLHE